MNKRQKQRLKNIIISGIIFIAAIIVSKISFSFSNIISIILFLAAYIIVGRNSLLKAVSNIKRGQVFDENFLMMLATLGAFAIKEFPEGVAVMLFYEVGELFQSLAVDKSRRSITELMDIRPDFANILLDDKSLKRVDPFDVNIGDKIVVKPGEKIALDGRVIQGSAMLDTVALTGESVPRKVDIGDEVLSACICIDGVLTIEVEKEFSESTASKILDLVENAGAKKSKTESFITSFAKVYTPIVVILALALAILPPLILKENFSVWLYRALAFLVVSCPCALVISVPLSFFGGIGAASKLGILIKGGNYIEALSNADVSVFDKTGTLTKGAFEVSKVMPIDMEEKEFIRLAAIMEGYSSHPIALSIKREYEKYDKDDINLSSFDIRDFKDISGQGISAFLEDKNILLGNAKLMRENSVSFVEQVTDSTIVYMAVDKVYKGYLLIEDKIKEDSKAAIEKLHSVGIKKTVMLTGDHSNTADKVAAMLGIDKVYAELLPQDKLLRLEEILEENKSGKTIFVGDGINDAPVLARADIGIAMGGLGSDAAIEAADVVIMNDEPTKIFTAIKLSKRTINIAMLNIVFALGIKVLVLILAALGIANMWTAVFADVGVSVIAILNSMRNLNTENL